MTFLLMRVIFDGFYLALILIAAKALTQPFFGLLPQSIDLMLQDSGLTSR